MIAKRYPKTTDTNDYFVKYSEVCCPVCGSQRLMAKDKQTRSLDEAATRFYICDDGHSFKKSQ